MTQLKLYNTLTRQKEPFEPIDAANVRMYVCGPTVYDFAHIGNARPAIVFDVLFRLLRHVYGENHVTYVRNITDVEDKINARALRDFPDLPLNQAIAKVTEKTANQYFADVKALGCLEPTQQPRATAYIPGMIEMIQSLIGKGNAYVATGKEGREVLFDVASMPDYGGLSKRNLDDQQAGARVAVEAHKKNPADFVLWKESSGDEPGWDATFDGMEICGRPGWHIECSVMAQAHLGEVFDIHGGGLDLIFPHHENEIAQSRCAHGTDAMANVWMHNGFLQVEGRKMSKSDGNFITIHELLETEKFGGRSWPGEVLRLAMLMTHYREPIDFSVKRLEEAENQLRDWSLAVVHVLERSGVIENSRFTRELVLPEPSKNLIDVTLDDLNFSETLKWLRENSRPYSETAAIQFLSDTSFLGVLGTDSALIWSNGLHPDLEADVNHDDLLKELRTSVLNNNKRRQRIVVERLSELGFAVSEKAPGCWRIAGGTSITPDEILGKTHRRLSLLAEKNFAEADKIRGELAGQGIQLMDYKDPETGEKRTKWEVKR